LHAGIRGQLPALLRELLSELWIDLFFLWLPHTDLWRFETFPDIHQILPHTAQSLV
jgi:hypothetical protein